MKTIILLAFLAFASADTVYPDSSENTQPGFTQQQYLPPYAQPWFWMAKPLFFANLKMAKQAYPFQFMYFNKLPWLQYTNAEKRDDFTGFGDKYQSAYDKPYYQSSFDARYPWVQKQDFNSQVDYQGYGPQRDVNSWYGNPYYTYNQYQGAQNFAGFDGQRYENPNYQTWMYNRYPWMQNRNFDNQPNYV